ncbi:WYL domain-containing protein [Rudanella paleaurantiibacter]|uniref:WYL domain-containing protein n=1 Tax=Rudanella paleaurantiibacter TaxID=2614655 RepID=A0A7J5TVM9_9BACT|nr:YafY family protein [Rudanella paleaurantiibacter]KAB7728355.1 WYL domain-containing protein [Rudanella paleaurantiibacter]
MQRLHRLTAILIHLQTKRVVRAQELADRFGISLRTVYRDVRSLEEAGVPIGAEAGVGYFLTDYHLPPVMFTNAEAGALVFAAKLIENWADESVQTAFDSALYKIKSVLKQTDQEHLDELAPQVAIQKPVTGKYRAGGLLNTIQQAIGRQHILRMHYQAGYTDAESWREVEPVGLYHYSMAWHLIAFCRHRQDYRDFRVDRIHELTDTGQRFARHARMTLRQYLDQMHSDMPLTNVTVVFDKSVVRFLNDQRHSWGFSEEEDLGDRVRMHLCTPYLWGLARWLLAFGSAVTVESPDELQSILQRLARDIQAHYLVGAEV